MTSEPNIVLCVVSPLKPNAIYPLSSSDNDDDNNNNNNNNNKYTNSKNTYMHTYPYIHKLNHKHTRTHTYYENVQCQHNNKPIMTTLFHLIISLTHHYL